MMVGTSIMLSVGAQFYGVGLLIAHWGRVRGACFGNTGVESHCWIGLDEGMNVSCVTRGHARFALSGFFGGWTIYIHGIGHT